MIRIDFFKYNSLKILPFVWFIRLGGRQRCVESETGAMEQKRLRNTGIVATTPLALRRYARFTTNGM